MCGDCKLLAAADWVAGHPALAAGLAALALVVVGVVIRR